MNRVAHGFTSLTALEPSVRSPPASWRPRALADQYIDDRYRLRRKLIPGDPQRGVPDLWAAEDTGDVYFVKVWRRGSGDQSDVKALWNREVRGLMRLQG